MERLPAYHALMGMLLGRGYLFISLVLAGAFEKFATDGRQGRNESRRNREWTSH